MLLHESVDMQLLEGQKDPNEVRTATPAGEAEATVALSKLSSLPSNINCRRQTPAQPSAR